MKKFIRIGALGLLYFLLAHPVGAQIKSAFGWYTVTESSDEQLWKKGSQFQLLSAHPDRAADSIIINNFTHHAVIAQGTFKGSQLNFWLQQKSHTPLEGGGEVWFVTLSGTATFRKGKIELSYSFKIDSFPTRKGTIVAEYFLPQYANQTNVNDTVIKGKWYQYALYDLNHHANYIGEIYTDNVRNGHWLFFDQQGMLLQSSYFINDTLNGASEFYTNSEYHRKPRYKLVGLMVDGKQVGDFISYEYQGKKWKKVVIQSFDANGKRIYSMQLYPNGKPLYQTFYSPDGKEIWYRGYDENGKLYKDDNVKEEYYIELAE